MFDLKIKYWAWIIGISAWVCIIIFAVRDNREEKTFKEYQYSRTFRDFCVRYDIDLDKIIREAK